MWSRVSQVEIMGQFHQLHYLPFNLYLSICILFGSLEYNTIRGVLYTK
jgi:hypothetical protein